MRNLFLGLAILMASLLSCSRGQNNWTELFNGKDLSGWNANENPGSFRVEEGLLVCSGARGHLFYATDGPFKNFELVAEIKTSPFANSGIYFHTSFQETGWPARGYEVQVNNTHIGADNYRETKKTGSLYAVRNVHYPLVNDGEWFNMRIKIIENHVEVFVNDIKVVDYIQPENPWRNEEYKDRLLREGTYGVAPNCGLHFPVTNDISLNAYMDTVKGQPIFMGMQAEGREWVTLFSPEAVARFDYVFTDAMTFTDSKGRRNRIWMPNEVWVDDKQQFMEQMVSTIEAIFSQEPVDIFVNPTVLPAVLMPEYEQLWTKERMERVVKVLADNNIALEINARYKTPSTEMIKMAKEAGVKFTFGTNNTSSELGRLEYCLLMIEECGLTPDDIFMPKPHNQKPVLVKGLPKNITG